MRALALLTVLAAVKACNPPPADGGYDFGAQESELRALEQEMQYRTTQTGRFGDEVFDLRARMAQVERQIDLTAPGELDKLPEGRLCLRLWALLYGARVIGGLALRAGGNPAAMASRVQDLRLSYRAICRPEEDYELRRDLADLFKRSVPVCDINTSKIIH